MPIITHEASDFLYKGVKLSTLTFRCHTWYSIPDLKRLCKEYFPGDFTFAGGCIPRFDLGIDPKAVWLSGMTETVRVPPMRHAKNAWYISEYALPGMFPNPVELPTLFLVLINEVKPAIMRHCKPVTDFPGAAHHGAGVREGKPGELTEPPAVAPVEDDPAAGVDGGGDAIPRADHLMIPGIGGFGLGP